MRFETNSDVLNWYEKQPRALTKEFIDGIPWKDVKNYPLDPKFIPVLFYMRDVETLTEVYYEELRRTPTGRDPVISKFMERWGVEELTHGELLNRFLNEAGIPTDEKWQPKVRQQLSTSYTVNNYLISHLANLVGRRFTATHMTFGAVHEMSTAQAYRRLITLSGHPVLAHILRGIIREESAHAQFYRCVARIELKNSPTAKKIARFIIHNFYVPVGSGAKSEEDTKYTIGTLFKGQEGREWIDKNVSQKLQKLPGFTGITKVGDTISQIADSHAVTA